MGLKRLRRAAAARGHSFNLRIGMDRAVLRNEYAQEQLQWDEREVYKKYIKPGDIVFLEIVPWPVVGRVVELDDSFIALGDAVRIMFDGRFGDFAKGAASIPGNARIEKHIGLYIWDLNNVIGAGVYPGGKIPDPR